MIQRQRHRPVCKRRSRQQQHRLLCAWWKWGGQKRVVNGRLRVWSVYVLVLLLRRDGTFHLQRILQSAERIRVCAVRDRSLGSAHLARILQRLYVRHGQCCGEEGVPSTCDIGKPSEEEEVLVCIRESIKAGRVKRTVPRREGVEGEGRMRKNLHGPSVTRSTVSMEGVYAIPHRTTETHPILIVATETFESCVQLLAL